LSYFQNRKFVNLKEFKNGVNKQVKIGLGLLSQDFKTLLNLSNGYLDNQRSIPFVSSDLIDPTGREYGLASN
jgi:hypothetical protein